MSQTIAYLRTSMDKQDLNNQKLEILEWARKEQWDGLDEVSSSLIGARLCTFSRLLLKRSLVGVGGIRFLSRSLAGCPAI